MWHAALWVFYNAKAAIYFIWNVFHLFQGNKANPIYPTKEDTFFLKNLRSSGGQRCAEFWTWGMPVKDISGDFEINKDEPWEIFQLSRVIPQSQTFMCVKVNPSPSHYPLKTQIRSIKQSVGYQQSYFMDRKWYFYFLPQIPLNLKPTNRYGQKRKGGSLISKTTTKLGWY